MAITGPLQSSGGEIRELNKIVICGDLVATEAYCAQLMDEIDETFDPSWIRPTLDRAEELGLGTADLSQVEIIEINTGCEVASENQKKNRSTGKPYRFELYQNYPNPFNPSTEIPYSLAKTYHVKLTVHDISGRKIATLVNTLQSAGLHKVTFDGSNLAAGVYIYRLLAGEHVVTQKMVLNK